MPHNFKINSTGAYFAKSGHDSNPFGDPNQPRATILGTNCVVGSGIYNQTISYGGSININLYADGYVKVITTSITGARGKYHGFEFYGSPSFQIGDQWASFFDCHLQNYIHGAGNLQLLTRGKFINSDDTTYKSTFNDVTIVSSNKYGKFKNCFASADSILIVDTFADLSYCNVQGVIVIEGNQYAVQGEYNGTPEANGYSNQVSWLNEVNLTTNGYTGTIVGWDAAIATCMNRPGLHNSAETGDYSLQAGSPMVGAADNGLDNIGGTKVALSYLVSQNGVGSTEVIVSPEIDTTNPNSYTLKAGETQGYVEFIVKLSETPITLNDIFVPLSDLQFDADYVGGSPQNRDVVDSFPLAADYPLVKSTNATANDATTVHIEGHNQIVGNYIRVNGEIREITAIPDADTVTVDSAFRANIGTGVTVQMGTETQMASLNPNRITFALRATTQATKPATDAEWDNSPVSPVYNPQGRFFIQEWFAVPELVVDAPNVYGGGDTNKPFGIIGSKLNATYVNVRIYLLNIYAS